MVFEVIVFMEIPIQQKSSREIRIVGIETHYISENIQIILSKLKIFTFELILFGMSCKACRVVNYLHPLSGQCGVLI